MSELPVARAVKHRGVAVAPPFVPWSRRVVDAIERVGGRPRAFVAAVVGLWPVTIALGVGAIVCYMALANHGT